MERNLSEKELHEWLTRLCADGALEMISGADGELLIPFIMNDAAEVYCVLRGVSVPGLLPENLDEAVSVEPVSGQSRKGFFIQNTSGIMATVWYTDCLYREELYQYHRIMHCWMPGNEHLRMLVYMIGTIRDKYEYLGEGSCNEMERALMPLLEYRPFRSFSPIDQSLDEWYPYTERGYEAVEEVARAAGETKLPALMRAGRFMRAGFFMRAGRFMRAGWIPGRLLDKKIAEQIASSGKIFELVYERICAASEGYAVRCYDDTAAALIRKKKEEVEKRLLGGGFTGTYPVYRKEGTRAVVFEEHPFTVPGMDEMEFTLHVLLCENRAGKNTYGMMEM